MIESCWHPDQIITALYMWCVFMLVISATVLTVQFVLGRWRKIKKSRRKGRDKDTTKH